MSHFRKIDVGMWNDEKFTALPVEGKLAWVMLLTHPMMTALGAMRATLGGLTEELCCGREGYREAFREGLQAIIDNGMADYDPKASFIALPNFLRYNRPESPNVVKAWAKAVEFLPECELKTLTIQRAVDYAEGLGEGFTKAIRQAFPKANGKPSRKTSSNQRAESSERRAVNQNGIDKEKLAPTYAREGVPIPVFKDRAKAGAWLSDRTDLFPAVPEFDTLVSLLMTGEFTQAHLQRFTRDDSF